MLRDYRKVLPDMIAKTSDCRYRQDPFSGKVKPHYGVDLAAEEGSPVYTPRGGEISRIGNSASYGYFIDIKYTGPGNLTIYARYAHLQEDPSVTNPELEEGKSIPADSQIGHSGNLGRS